MDTDKELEFTNGMIERNDAMDNAVIRCALNFWN